MLVLSLLMLVVLTLLAITGMGTANIETIMAANEQFRESAAQAASAGIERAIAGIESVSSTAAAQPVTVGPVSSGPSGADTFSTRTRFVGTQSGLPQSSADKFVGLHFLIESSGASARNARDVQVQGIMVISASAPGASTFRGLGEGLVP